MDELITSARLRALVVILMCASGGLSVWTGAISVLGVQLPGRDMLVDFLLLTCIELVKYSSLIGARASRSYLRSGVFLCFYLVALALNGWYLHRYTAHVETVASTPIAVQATKDQATRRLRDAERSALQAKLDAAYHDRDYGRTSTLRDAGTATAARLQKELYSKPAIALTDAEAGLTVRNDAKTIRNDAKTIPETIIQWAGDNRFAVLLGLLDAVILLIPVGADPSGYTRISMDERSARSSPDVRGDIVNPLPTVRDNDRRPTLMTRGECEAWVLQVLLPRVGDKTVGSYQMWGQQAGASKPTMYAAIGVLEAGGFVTTSRVPGSRGTTLTRVRAELKLVG